MQTTYCNWWDAEEPRKWRVTSGEKGKGFNTEDTEVESTKGTEKKKNRAVDRPLQRAEEEQGGERIILTRKTDARCTQP